MSKQFEFEMIMSRDPGVEPIMVYVTIKNIHEWNNFVAPEWRISSIDTLSVDGSIWNTDSDYNFLADYYNKNIIEFIDYLWNEGNIIVNEKLNQPEPDEPTRQMTMAEEYADRGVSPKDFI